MPRVLTRLPLTFGPFVLGIVFTLGLLWIAWHDTLEDEQRKFAVDASNVRDQIFQRVNAADEIITNLATLINSSMHVDADQFRLFSEDILRRHRFLSSTAYAPLVTAQERREFESYRRRLGFPTFSISERRKDGYSPAAARERYFPLLYQEPFEPQHALMIGFDLPSNPVLGEAIARTIETADPRSAPISEHEYWSFKAVYAGKTVPEDVVARRKAVNGLVALRIDAKRLLADAVNAGHLALYMRLHTVGTDRGAVELTYVTDNVDTLLSIPLARQYRLTLHGQRLDLRIERRLHWRNLDYRMLFLAILVGALVTASLVFAGRNIALRALELHERNREIERQVARQTAELALEKDRAEVTLASIGDAVITTDAGGAVEYLNPVAEQLTGWTNAKARGQPLAQVFRLIDEQTHRPTADPIAASLAEGQGTTLARDALLLMPDGTECAIDHSVAPIRSRDGMTIGAVLVFHDVSQARKMAQEMSYQASHDALTGLANRRAFEDRLAELLTQAKSKNKTHAMLYLDLDQFKIVNDACGHVAGDELLRQVSTQLLSEVRRADMVARLGGDEFGVLLYSCPPSEAMQIAEKLRQAVHEFRFSWKDRQFAVGVSIGLVMLSADSESPSTVLSAADAACYAAKDKGRNRVQIFRPNDSMLARRRTEMQWVSRLTRAIEQDRFVLYAQPMAPIQDESLERCYEVLIRMLSEDGEVVPPGAFIPAAERYNLMPAIDRWAIRTMFKWIAQAPTEATYSINLSGQSLNDEGFLDFLFEQFERNNIKAENICLEITETAAVANLSSAMQFIQTLKQLGCRFVLDDFGSGWSSFAYLKNLPVDYLKIDGGFVKDMAHDVLDFVMVNAIHQMGHAMGIKTVAEFVETDEILQKLRAVGVDYAQGSVIDIPRPLAEVVLHQPRRTAPGEVSRVAPSTPTSRRSAWPR